MLARVLAFFVVVIWLSSCYLLLFLFILNFCMDKFLNRFFTILV